ncbi:MAG: hypothetical protein K2O44_01770 [Clostridia bacterium]|nr:hypothetical protein [Clostridia bacterium]
MAKSKAKSSAKTGKKNVLAVILALVFLGVCAFCGAGIGLRDKTSGKWYSTPSWYHNWGKKEAPEETGTKTSNAVISEGESNGIALLSEYIPVEAYSDYGIAQLAADSYYYLSVEYTPANTTYQETDINIDFKNPASSWASGKKIGNYAYVNHEEGSTNATLCIVKGFEEQIIVTARSQRVPELYATATVDWVHTGISTAFCSGVDDIDTDYELDVLSWYGGTVAPDSENCIEFRFEAPGFASFMSSKGYSYSSSDQTSPSDTYSIFISYDENLIGQGIFNARQVVIGLIGDSYADDRSGSWSAASEFFLHGQKPEQMNGYSWITVRVYLHSRFTRDYDDGSGYTIEIGVYETDSYDLEFEDWSGFEVKASNITLTPSDIVGY